MSDDDRPGGTPGSDPIELLELELAGEADPAQLLEVEQGT